MSVLVNREMTIFLPREVDRSPSVRLDPWAQLDIRVYLALLCEALAESGDILMDLGYSCVCTTTN